MAVPTGCSRTADSSLVSENVSKKFWPLYFAVQSQFNELLYVCAEGVCCSDSLACTRQAHSLLRDTAT